MRNLVGIEAFVAVAETGSFTRAAERLQTNKSSVSDGVRKLEDKLGVRLIERTTRSMRLTQPGSVFLTRCRKLLDDLDMVKTEARSFLSVIEGHLRVAVPETLGDTLIIPALADLIVRHPKLTIDLVAESSVIKPVANAFDVAIRIIDSPSQTSVVRRLATQRIAIVGSPAYLDRQGSPSTAMDLHRHRLVGTAWPLPWADRWSIDGQVVKLVPRLTVNTAGALRSAALSGLGLVPAPDWLVLDLLASGALRRVLEGSELPTTGIYAVYPTHRHISPAVRTFIDFVEGHLRSRGIRLD